MKIFSSLALASIGFSTAVLIWVCQADATTVLNGLDRVLGNGAAHTYVVLDESNRPVEVGVLMTESALSNLPTDKVELNLALPTDVAARIPFTHIGLNWNPHGHAPEPIYGNPHFDFHFYTISEADRQYINGDRLERSYISPAAEYVPSSYMMAPDSAEPTQGAHWVNANATEFQGEPHGFEHTFIYGFYNGQLSFLEPMVGLQVLEQRQDVDEEIALPKTFAQPGTYPTGYSITYDAEAQVYRIALTI